MARNLGRLVVDYEWLKKALGLPEDAVVLGVSDAGRFGAMELKLEHPTLPVVEEGTVIPVIHPTYEDRKLVGWERGVGLEF
jgi:hypothetical protein